LADALGAPYVRVFGGGQWENPVTDHDVARAAAAAVRCREELYRRGILAEMLMETHFGFSSSIHCVRINEMLPSPLPILWDSHHTWRRHGESPSETWSRIAPWVRHIHYKDSRREDPTAGDGLHVLPGEGEYPARELRDLLKREAYAGGVSLEWEKLWHRDLPELSSALPLFLAQFRAE
jgi:sugar phosphate isomerase/epimerase